MRFLLEQRIPNGFVSFRKSGMAINCMPTENRLLVTAKRSGMQSPAREWLWFAMAKLLRKWRFEAVNGAVAFE
jgi:hypothetical protein